MSATAPAPMLTATVLTDEQISKFRWRLPDSEWRLRHDCLVAVGVRPSPHRGGKLEARARVAAAMSAERLTVVKLARTVSELVVAGNPPELSDVHTRHVAPGAPPCTGTIVYRVIEVDPPPDVPGPHTWEVAAVVIERASTKQIKLRHHFRDHARTVFDPTAFGRLFFETPLQAIQAFLAERRLELEALYRKEKEAERAIAWAERQDGEPGDGDRTG